MLIATLFLLASTQVLHGELTSFRNYVVHRPEIAIAIAENNCTGWIRAKNPSQATLLAC